MPLKAPYPIEDEHDFKGWRLMRPHAAKLLKEIIFRHRGSSIRVPGKPGKWAVYPIATWCEWTGFSLDQVERALPFLELDGLIRRERHRFGGKTVRSFIQPTELALKYLGRPQEKIAAEALLAASSEGTSAGASAGTSAGTDNTSLFSPSTSPTYPKKAPSSESEEGKGKAHTKESTKKKPANPPMKESATCPAGGDVELLAKLKALKQSTKLDKHAKRDALLELLPPVPGAVSVGVRHPSEMHPKKWHSWSPELHLKRYATYVEYAQNALNKGSGKKSMAAKSDINVKLPVGMDPEDDAEMAKLDAECGW